MEHILWGILTATGSRSDPRVFSPAHPLLNWVVVLLVGLEVKCSGASASYGTLVIIDTMITERDGRREEQ